MVQAVASARVVLAAQGVLVTEEVVTWVAMVTQVVMAATRMAFMVSVRQLDGRRLR